MAGRFGVRALLGGAALLGTLTACVPPPAPHTPAVAITQPASGDSVTSPMAVRGTAEVFEAVFFLEVTDAVGTVLTTQRLMASCDTTCPGTFEVTVSFQSPPGPIKLTAFTRSAEDGSRVDETAVDLVVAP